MAKRWPISEDEMIRSVFFLILLIASIGYAYKPWFHPDEYLYSTKVRRQRVSRKNVFALFQIPSVNVLTKHHSADIWLARLASLLIVLGLTIAFLASVADLFLIN